MSTGLSSDGYTAPRTADFLTTIRDEYEAQTGLTIDWDADVFLGQITASMASRLNDIAEASQALYDARSPANATGVQLDDLAAVVGVPREPATFSQATVTCTGVADTVIPAGTLVEGGGNDDDSRWATSADVTIGGGGTVDVVVVAEDIGAVVATTGQIDKIVSAISGWTSVSNAAAATTGDAEETDATLRTRRASSVQVAGSRSLSALVAQLVALDSITNASVIDNDTAFSVVVEGKTLDPHSVAVIIYPATLTDAQKLVVLELIYGNVNAGTKTMGTDVVGVITGEDGFPKTVRFDWATDLTVNVVTTVVLEPGFVIGDVDTAVQSGISSYFDGLEVGEDVRILQVLGAIADVEGVAGATVTLNGGSIDITTTTTEIAILGTNTVST